MDFLVGADPEVFVQRDGKFVSGHGLIQGDKKHPFKVDGGAVQVDGMALEFNIDPAKSSKEFVHSIRHVMGQLAAMVPEYTLVATPVAEFGKKEIKRQPPEALELGCDPDYNAYTGEPNPKPDGERTFRTGAGHVHIGWTKDMDVNDPEHIEACRMLTKQLDVYLGIPSVILDPDTKRREMYGKAGCYRVKPYGVEYRVLSNFWLKSPELMAWVYKQTKLAFDKLIAGERRYENTNVVTGASYDLEVIINNSRVKQAEILKNYLSLEMPNAI